MADWWHHRLSLILMEGSAIDSCYSFAIHTHYTDDLLLNCWWLDKTVVNNIYKVNSYSWVFAAAWNADTVQR